MESSQVCQVFLVAPKLILAAGERTGHSPGDRPATLTLVFYPQKEYMTQIELMSNRENQIQRPIGLQVLVLAGQGQG